MKSIFLAHTLPFKRMGECVKKILFYFCWYLLSWQCLANQGFMSAIESPDIYVRLTTDVHWLADRPRDFMPPERRYQWLMDHLRIAEQIERNLSSEGINRFLREDRVYRYKRDMLMALTMQELERLEGEANKYFSILENMENQSIDTITSEEKTYHLKGIQERLRELHRTHTRLYQKIDAIHHLHPDYSDVDWLQAGKKFRDSWPRRSSRWLDRISFQNTHQIINGRVGRAVIRMAR